MGYILTGMCIEILIIGGIIIKKLYDIHAEIEYFEWKHDIWCNKKGYDRIKKKISK